jgi:hypothetical protein
MNIIFKARERLGNQTPPASLRPPYSPRPFTRSYPNGRIYYESYKDNSGEYKLFISFIGLNGDGYIDGRKYHR